MMITIHTEQLHNLVAGAAFVAARTASMMMGGSDKNMLLQKQAYARYGNKTVKRWHKAGLLHPKRIDGCIYFPAIELLVASQTEMINSLTPMASDEVKEYVINKIQEINQ